MPFTLLRHLNGWVGELGQSRQADRSGEARAKLSEIRFPEEEAMLKNTRAYGSTAAASAAGNADPGAHNHFGLVVVSCDEADLRPMPSDVQIYGHRERDLDAIPPPSIPRAEVLDELYSAVVCNKPPIHSGEWSLATMEVYLAILKSAAEGRELQMAHQCGVTTPA